jgi:hypothetical protein
MLTCKSPRKVMRAAYHLARQSLPEYSSKFSRRDFTLPQLFACRVAKEHLKRSYRGAEALLRDCDNWLADVGLSRAPDHNTLCRAASLLLGKCRVGRLLDQLGTPGRGRPDPGAVGRAAGDRQHDLREPPRQPPLRAAVPPGPRTHEAERREKGP